MSVLIIDQSEKFGWFAKIPLDKIVKIKKSVGCTQHEKINGRLIDLAYYMITITFDDGGMTTLDYQTSEHKRNEAYQALIKSISEGLE